MKIKLLLCKLLLLYLGSVLTAQELVVNGGFEDDSGWTIYYLNGTEQPGYEFNYTVDGPSAGSGGCLNIFATGTFPHILFWQELTLTGGQTYKLTGAFAELTGVEHPFFWCQLYLSTLQPVDDGGDWNPEEDRQLGFNSAVGCGGHGVDGTFQDDGCDGKATPFYIAPGDPGSEVTIYLGLKAGSYSAEVLSFDILVDEVSLVPWDTSATIIRNDPTVVLTGYQLYQNYPNPFNLCTNIRFFLPAAETVNLSVFDMTGCNIRTLANETFVQGEHTLTWNGKNDRGMIVPSGIYFYRLMAGGYSEMKKCLICK
jgi:hypothetical protein